MDPRYRYAHRRDAGTLSGEPCIEGTRIGVLHALTALECGHSPEEIASKAYPHLTTDQVTEVVDWLYDHPDRVYELRLRKSEPEILPRLV